MLIQQTVGGSYSSSAGGGSTNTPNAVNERIFRVVRNSFTATATVTAASFVRGNPAVLATESASNNGYDIKHGDTQGANLPNNLLIGAVYDYPDTTVGRTGVFQPEAVGLVQCYGLMTNAVVAANSSTLILPGVILTPDTGSQFKSAVGPVTAASTGTAANVELTGIGGLIYLAASLASSTAAGTASATVFIRCM